MRIIWRFILLAVVAAAFTWFADRPGALTVDWLGYRVEVSLGVALLALFAALLVLWLLWSFTSHLFHAPGAVSGYFRGRRAKRGHEALSRGLVAVAAGDAQTARRQAQLTHRLLPDDPLSRLLEAQAAQLEGDHRRVRSLFESMSEEPETRLVALRGLYAEARKEGDEARARQIAERAYGLNPGLRWASEAVLAGRALDRDWPAVVPVLDAQRNAGTLDEEAYRRRRAAVHAAQAIAAEEADAAAALDLAGRALRYDPGLVPAAAVAARVYIAQGSLRKATRVLEKAWAVTPHPDLAEIDAHARAGDAPLDRLKRVQDLLKVSPGGEEGAVALARAAIDARDWTLARHALAPHAGDRPRARVCTLMAQIEAGDTGDRGRAREWLARAIRAPRDPLWIAGGYMSETWLPVSPDTGEIGAFAWKAPPDALAYSSALPVEAIALLAAEPEPVPPEPLPQQATAQEAPPELPPEPEPPAPSPPPRSEPPQETPRPVLVHSEPPVAPEPPQQPPSSPDRSAAKEPPPALQHRQPDDPGPEPEPDEAEDTGWPRKLVS